MFSASMIVVVSDTSYSSLGFSPCGRKGIGETLEQCALCEAYSLKRCGFLVSERNKR